MGETLQARMSEIEMGAINRIVVTLSRKADTNAVTILPAGAVRAAADLARRAAAGEMLRRLACTTL